MRLHINQYNTYSPIEKPGGDGGRKICYTYGMKIPTNRRFTLALMLGFLFATPLLSQAHGGVSQTVGNVVVHLNQTPISPLLGEEVTMNFSIRNLQNKPIPNLPIELNLTDTFYGDATKDKLILTKNFTTDVNGDFAFTYSYNKENYFDIDLNFQDPDTKQDEETGFLVQPRDAVIISTKQAIYQDLGLLAMGFLLALIAQEYWWRKK